jgi:sporulation protein YlmC with PRC-barrel domain
MLITHLKPAELWGKKVYDAKGRFLGEVVAIGSRRGVVHKVVVQRLPHDRRVRIVPPVETRVETNVITLPVPTPSRPTWLRLVR